MNRYRWNLKYTRQPPGRKRTETVWFDTEEKALKAQSNMFDHYGIRESTVSMCDEDDDGKPVNCQVISTFSVAGGAS